jgi:hypothetical protein
LVSGVIDIAGKTIILESIREKTLTRWFRLVAQRELFDENK